MKRFHVHINVDTLEPSIRFYSMLFGCAPVVVHADYAQWMLEDPRINFAISQHGGRAGIDHMGLQADDEAELAAIGSRLVEADAVTLAEQGTTCCYARSDTYWAEDPQGVRWESFRTLGASTTYSQAPAEDAGAACCGPVDAVPEGAACAPRSQGSCC